MEDFFYAGGLPALMQELGDKLDLSVMTVSGKTLGENIEGAVNYNDDDVIRPLSNPVYHEGSLAVLRGNLAPDGAVIKPAAMDPKFQVHIRPAIVADSYPELKEIINDEDYPMTPDHVLVLRNAGPQGGPGMPEWGMIPMPKALLKDRGTATWCVCRMRACRARLMAPASCMWRPRLSSAGLWP